MKNSLKIIDNLTISYVFIMTFFVSAIVSKVQSLNTDLEGEELWIFLAGFVGSMICIIIRYVIVYKLISTQVHKVKRYLGMIYLALWLIASVGSLHVVLYNSGYSIGHEHLHGYNAYLYFMLVIVIAQWLGIQLFVTDKRC